LRFLRETLFGCAATDCARLSTCPQRSAMSWCMPSTTQRAWTSERPRISRAQRCTRNPPASLLCMLFATLPRAHTAESLIFFCPSAGARGRPHRVRELVALPTPLLSRVARRAPPRKPRVSSTPRVPVTLHAAAPGSGFVRAACAARRCAPCRSLAAPRPAAAPRARSSARAGRPPCPRPAANARRPAPPSCAVQLPRRPLRACGGVRPCLLRAAARRTLCASAPPRAAAPAAGRQRRCGQLGGRRRARGFGGGQRGWEQRRRLEEESARPLWLWGARRGVKL